MQIKKENIKQNILEVSREEFLKKGFKDASMRAIAKRAGVTLSNIYNYFRNKNEILGEVLAPLLRAFDTMEMEHNSPEYITTDYFFKEEYQLRHSELFVELILKFKDELKLLFFNSHGSSFENFRDEFTDKHTKTGMEYLKLMKEKHPHVNTDISEFFIHTMSSWWLSILGEIVSHDLTENEIRQFIHEYVKFGTAGWQKMMNV